MVRFPDNPPENKSESVHGKPAVSGIFNNKKTSRKPPNYLSPPPPGAPEAWLSNLSVYRLRTAYGWILNRQEEQLFLLFAKADDQRKNRPDLAELDKTPLWPPPNYCMWWTSKSWHKRWRRDRGQGIWPEPRHCTSGRWAKNGLALHFHKLVLDIVDQREWRREGRKPIANPARHLPFEDRVAAAMLGLAEAIHRFDRASPNGLAAYAIWWIRKELQRLARNERRQPQEDHESYGFGEGEFGLGIPMSFWPRKHPLIGYDEENYRRRVQYITVEGCLVENIKLGAPADDNDDVEYVGLSFVSWSPINPETALLAKEAAWEKYNYRAADEIVQQLRDDKEIKFARSERRYRCDGSTIVTAAAVNAARRDWRARKNKPHLPETTPASLVDHTEMAFLPASVFAPV
jgi:hypothetical protein